MGFLHSCFTRLLLPYTILNQYIANLTESKDIYSQDCGIKIGLSSLIFLNYPFKPSSVCQNENERGESELNAKDIVGYINLPFALIVRNECLSEPFYELIKIRSCDKGQFEGFIKRNGVQEIHHMDNWIALLEEYLDTEYTQETHEWCMNHLMSNGFTQEEISAIKKREGKMMDRYNTFAWEWICLDVFDVLFVKKCNKQSNKHIAFYRRAMEIALQGAKLPKLEY
ncbi:hypothetical protein T36_0197 [Helicobacter cinaedi]|uniref:hypothetical protein n=1 Tax=Helicobacter cinaedi TaxID=213 RepID=UPI001F226B7E|nr:hypothetical protein [Helicobacter cinaedi]BDB63753.1 hypothetical protein T36_0197 [Helicobacter cinaedi]